MFQPYQNKIDLDRSFSTITTAKVPYDGTNLPLFEQWARSFFLCFGGPGMAILTNNRDADTRYAPEPVRPAVFEFCLFETPAPGTPADAPPVVTRHSVSWDSKIHEPGFERKVAEWKRQQEKDREHAAKLMCFLFVNITPSVITELSADGDHITTLHDTCDTFRFWQLLRAIYYGTSANKGFASTNARMRWSLVSQIDNETKQVRPLADYLTEYDMLLRAIKGTTAEPGRQEQIAILLRGLDPERYKSVVHPLVQKPNFDDVDIPTLRHQLINLELYIAARA